ncbi:hypothetical protein TWF694_006367 [Orbilia ellipsospora]|uniref:Uncharacterized protein n=1 Tax=Orbilia ellipsospora TaxID=2528407 RepID=A0AAV9XLD6_9PEZI
MDVSTISINPQRKFPWEWTPQEVVLYLSRRLHLKKYFESATLKSAFTNNEITGYVLLYPSFTLQTLKEDLGIRQAGIRIGIWRVIEALRTNYPLPSNLDLNDDELLLSPPEPPTSDGALALIEEEKPVTDIVRLPETTVFRFGQFSAERLPSEAHSSSRFFSTPGPSTLVTRRPPPIFQPEDVDLPSRFGRSLSLSVDMEPVSFDLPTPKTPTPSRESIREDSPPPLNISRLKTIEDDTGSLGSTGMELSITNSGAIEVVGNGSSETAQGDDRMVVDPLQDDEEPAKNSLITPQLSPDLPPRELSSEKSNKRVRTSRSPDQVRPKRRRGPRSSTYLGNPVSIGERMLVGDTISSDTSDTFVIFGKTTRHRAQATPGAIQSVNSWFKAFLKRPIEIATINGKPHQAYPLYTIRHVQRFTRHPITVINEDEVKDGEDIKNYIEKFPGLDVRDNMYRKKADRVTFLDPAMEGRRDLQYVDPYMRLDGEDALIALEAHYNNQEDSGLAIPVNYRRGRSPGLDSETLAEMRRDQMEESVRNEQRLTVEQITQVFEETRDSILDKWRALHIPALEKKKYKLWTEARKGKYEDAKRNAREEIGQFMIKIQESETQIEAQRNEYLIGKWASAAKLRRMIRAGSKVSLENQEEYRWKVEAIRGKRPERPPPKPRQPRNLTVPQSFDEEPESLWIEYSEVDDSDGVGDDGSDGVNDLDGFIVSDNVYDEGHEDLRAPNEAFLTEHASRFQRAAADIEIEDAIDSQMSNLGSLFIGSPFIGSPFGEDIVLPDAAEPVHPLLLPNLADLPPAAPAKEKTPVVEREAITEKGKQTPKKAEEEHQWFSNFSQSSPMTSPVDPVPPDAESMSGNPFTMELDNNESAAPVAPVPLISHNRELIASTASSAITQLPQVKKELSPLISRLTLNCTDVIDLTEDTPNHSPILATTSGPSRNKRLEPIDLVESDHDIEMQQAIENSLQNTHAGSSQQQYSHGPSQSGSVTRIPKSRPVIYNSEKSKPLLWKQTLQKIYDNRPNVMIPMLEIARGTNKTRSSLPLEERVMRFIDRMRGLDHLKAKKYGTQALGLTPEEQEAHRSIARLYYEWSYPTGKAQNMDKAERMRLAKELNLRRFIRDLTPILDEVAAWEGLRYQSVGADASKNPESSHTAEERSFFNQESFFVDDHDQPTQENTLLVSNDKGKGKQRAVIPDPESDYEPETQNFGQTSTRFSSPAASQASKPRHVIHRKEMTEEEETLILREKKRKETRSMGERVRVHKKQGLGEKLVNLGHYAKYDSVYFPESNEPLYDFQRDGIQAMWREVVSSNMRSGVLLAHTMGMGKTRQVLTLLRSISDSAQSTNPKIAAQIPDHLKTMRALIVAPPGLLENWSEEIVKWKMDCLNPVYIVGSKYEPHQRPEIIRQWAKDGTLLLIGYEIFRSFFAQHPDYRVLFKGLKSKEPVVSVASDIPDLLLQTPTIVVADEAHRLKNSGSVLAKIFRKFTTRSRIAMTGSPLTNNLSEYYNIVKWIDEIYAGTEAYFNNTYKYPIEDGLWAESLPEEVSRSRVKQKVLIDSWKLKIHRVNIASLQHDQNMLPPKTEFVITLPLSDLQYDIYELYAKIVKRKIQGQTQDFFRFIQDLAILLNHPQIFWDDVVLRVEKKTKATCEPAEIRAAAPQDDFLAQDGVGDDALGEPVPLTAERSTMVTEDRNEAENLLGQLQGSIYHEVKAIIGSKPYLNLSDPSHSFRIIALIRILDACIAIKEKVLVFSQSVKTLEYLAKILKKRGTAYSMLHGKIGTDKRQGMTKDFSDSDTCVFLISTRAGGLGLNIQSASRIVIFDCLFSPQDEEQAVGRAYRLGQTKHVFVYRFRIGGTYEDIIYNQSLLKTSLALRMLDKKAPRRTAQKNKASDWFNPPKKLNNVEADIMSFMGKDPKVLDGLLGEEWVKSLQDKETYELHKDEDLTAEETKQYEAQVLEEEMRRAGASDVNVPPGSANKFTASGLSKMDAKGEIVREPRARKKKDSIGSTPTQHQSTEMEQVGNPGSAQSPLRQILNLGRSSVEMTTWASGVSGLAPSAAPNKPPALKLRGAAPAKDPPKQ